MKYALVTGGSRGIGKAICIRLAKNGIPVLINYHSNEVAAKAVLEEIQSIGGVASILQFDVAVEQDVAAAIDKWEAEHPNDYITRAYERIILCS